MAEKEIVYGTDYHHGWARGWNEARKFVMERALDAFKFRGGEEVAILLRNLSFDMDKHAMQMEDTFDRLKSEVSDGPAKG